MTILIHDWDRANSHSAKSTFDTADEELVLQPCILLKYTAIVMHVVCRTTVLDPDSIELSYRDVSHCLMAVCEAAEYGTECLAIIVARFSIADTAKYTSSMATTSSSIAFEFLITISMLRIVFHCNPPVALRFDMASITTIIATDPGGTAGCITCVVRLHDIGIRDTQICGKTGEV